MTPWIAAYQAPPSMGFSRQEYWSGAPVPSLTKLCITSIIPILLDIYFKNLCISMHRKEKSVRIFQLPKMMFGEGNGTPLQYSCLENPMDRGAWWAAVHGVAKSRTRLSDFTFTFHFHALYKEMATHSSVLAWRIPWIEEPGGLQSTGSLRVGQDSATSLSLFPFMHWRRKWQPTPVFLPGESQGQGSLVGCRLWGRTESDTTEAT